MEPSKYSSSETENKEKQIEIKLKIKLDEKSDEIYKIYELSDERLGVELDQDIKIYSLKNFQKITEIHHSENINNSIELKNKDIAITGYNIVYFYKLSENNNYIYYKKIELEEKNKIFEIYELNNENLILCIRRDLLVYTKQKEEYKFLINFELDETVGKILEIKNNILFLFLFSRCRTFATADYSPYYLQIIDIEKQIIYEIKDGHFSRKDDKYTFYGCNILYNENNKYLFTRYANSFDIYDINDIENDNIKCIYSINRKNNLSQFPIDFESLCSYENNFIILPSQDIYKFDEMKKKIIFLKKFPIKIDKIIDMIKLKKHNNIYIAHSKNELYIINNN